MQLRALPLLLFISLTQAEAQQPPAEQHAGAIIAVMGLGKLEVRPDHAQFLAVVSTRGRNLAEAAKAHEERATQALSLLHGLKDAGVDITEASFRLNRETPPAGRPPAEKPLEPQFIAVTTFDLKARPIEALNGIVTKLASSGLFELRSVTFLVDQERKALNDARREAVRNARDQAEAYADAAGVRLGEIAEITDGDVRAADGEADLAAPAFVQVIPPATVSFRAWVKMVWRIAPR